MVKVEELVSQTCLENGKEVKLIFENLADLSLSLLTMVLGSDISVIRVVSDDKLGLFLCISLCLSLSHVKEVFL